MLQQGTVSKHAGFDSLDIWAIGSLTEFWEGNGEEEHLL